MDIDTVEPVRRGRSNGSKSVCIGGMGPRSRAVRRNARQSACCTSCTTLHRRPLTTTTSAGDHRSVPASCTSSARANRMPDRCDLRMCRKRLSIEWVDVAGLDWGASDHAAGSHVLRIYPRLAIAETARSGRDDRQPYYRSDCVSLRASSSARLERMTGREVRPPRAPRAAAVRGAGTRTRRIRQPPP